MKRKVLFSGVSIILCIGIFLLLPVSSVELETCVDLGCAGAAGCLYGHEHMESCQWIRCKGGGWIECYIAP